jgi:hypothetical protein
MRYFFYTCPEMGPLHVSHICVPTPLHVSHTCVPLGHIYDQVNPHDAFGAMMVANITARGCVLKSIHAFPDLASQRRRYLERGWLRCEGKGENKIKNNFYTCIPGSRFATEEIPRARMAVIRRQKQKRQCCKCYLYINFPVYK